MMVRGTIYLVGLVLIPTEALVAMGPVASSVRLIERGAGCERAACPVLIHSSPIAAAGKRALGTLREPANGAMMPHRRSRAPVMVSPVGLALDAVGFSLKAAWRLAFGAAAARLVLAALEMPAIAKFVPEALASNVRARLKAIFKPKELAAEAAKAKAAKPPAPSADGLDALALDDSDASAETLAADGEGESTDADTTEAEETMTPEEAEAAKKAAEEFAAKAAAIEAAEKAKAEKEALEREAAEREAAAKAAEERERFRKKMEEEKAAAEAKAKAEAEARAKAKAEAEAAAAAAKAAAEAARAKLEAAAPAHAGREELATSLIQEVAEGVEFPFQVLSMSAAASGVQSKLEAAIADLEANYEPFDAEVVSEGLIGFWKVLITDSETMANDGMTGYGRDEYSSILAHYQSFTKNQPGSVLPTIQTVEVVSDTGLTGTVSCQVAALKGDFSTEASADGAGVDVIEGYTWAELAGAKQFDQTPKQPRWKCTYISPTLRVCRGEGNALTVYAKAEAETCTGEIAEFITNPPDPNGGAPAVADVADSAEDVDEEEGGRDGDPWANVPDDPNDDRPLWQRRLDAEKNSGTLDDDSGSSIP